jgi:hypothetical protein
MSLAVGAIASSLAYYTSLSNKVLLGQLTDTFLNVIVRITYIL